MSWLFWFADLLLLILWLQYVGGSLPVACIGGYYSCICSLLVLLLCDKSFCCLVAYLLPRLSCKYVFFKGIPATALIRRWVWLITIGTVCCILVNVSVFLFATIYTYFYLQSASSDAMIEFLAFNAPSSLGLVCIHKLPENSIQFFRSLVACIY